MAIPEGSLVLTVGLIASAAGLLSIVFAILFALGVIHWSLWEILSPIWIVGGSILAWFLVEAIALWLKGE